MENQKSQFVLSLLAYAVQRDIPLMQLCKLADIELKELKDGSHPPVTDKQLAELWHHASQLCNDPLFGLHFGESLQLAALGIVGEIIKSSKTVGDALTQASELIFLLSDRYRIEIKKSLQSFKVQLILMDKSTVLTFPLLQMRDLLMVFMIHELDGLMLEKITPTSVTLLVEDENIDEYSRVLRCTPTNSKTECFFVFPPRYWNEPILTANYELQHSLLQKVKHEKLKTRVPLFHTRIEQYLSANAYLGLLSVEDVAANFNLSVRSLQRKLSEEGVSFQQLADTVRKSLAEHYLKSGKYQVKEISMMLGYNELSAFSRAFKRWTGKSPNAYKA